MSLDKAIPDNIMHQTQSHVESCWATTAAMVSGVSKYQIEDELKLMGVDPFDHLRLENLEKVLARHNILLRQAHMTVAMSSPGVFILSVPYVGSAKIRFNVHAIVVDNRDGKLKVYDPMQGFPSLPPVKYYSDRDSESTVEFKLDMLTYGFWRCVDCNVGTP